MAGVVLLARETGRAGRAAAALGWAAALLLLADPALVGDAGFQLSVAGDGRPHRLGDAAHRAARARSAAAGVPRWLARGPRRLARGPGGDAADRPRRRSGGWRSLVAARQPRVVPLVPPAMAAGLRRPRRRLRSCWSGAPPSSAPSSRLPGWVVLAAPRRDRRRRGGAAVRERHARRRRSTWRRGVARRGDRRRRGGRPSDRRAVAPTARPAAGPTAAGAGRPARAAAAGGDRVARSRGGHRAVASSLAGRASSWPARRRGHARRPASARHGPRRRAGRRDPRRGRARRPAARRRRPGPGPAARRARRADPAVGPADRRRRPDPPPRGPRRRPGAAARALPRRAGRSSPGCAGPGPGYAAWLRRLDRPGRAGPAAPRGRRPARPSTRSTLRVLWPIRGRVPREPPDGGTGINNVSIVLLGDGRRAAVPADGRRRGGHRPDRSLAGGLPAGRPAQGRPPRQPDGDDRGVRRRRPAAGRGRVGRRRQPVRAPGPGDPRPARRGRRAGPADRPRRDASRSTFDDRRGWTCGATGGRPAAATATRAGDAARRAVPVRDPGPVARSRTREPPTPADRAARRAPAARRRASGTIGPMTVPSRVAAAALLLSLDPPPWLCGTRAPWPRSPAGSRRGSTARGIAVDRRLVEAAALLHDVDKALPADDPARALPHGDGSAAWLTRQRPPRARPGPSRPTRSPACSTASAYRRWAAFATREERIVAYADKRAGQRLESMDARFASLAAALPAAGRRRPRSRAGRRRLRPVRARAERLEADVCRAAGRRAGRGPPAALDRGRAPARAAARWRDRRDDRRRSRYFWGDDELRARARASTGSRRRSRPRAARRWSAGCCAATGTRRRRSSASSHERVATAASCSAAGRWRSSSNPGRSSVKGEDRDAFLAAIGARRARQRPGLPRRRATSGAQGRRRRSGLADAVAGGRRRGPRVPGAARGRAGRLDRGARRASAACASSRAPRRRSPSGSAAFVREGDVERRHQTRPRLDGARQARPLPPRRRRSGRRRPGARRRGRARARSGRSLDAVGERRGRERALGAARAAARGDARAGPARRPPSAGPRAASSRRPARRRRAAAGRRQGDRASPASSGRRSCASRRGAGRRPSSIAALDGLRRARRDGQGRARARIATRRSGGWRSACG